MTIPDDSETIDLFEPLMVSEASPARAGLNDLALELAETSAALRSGLPASVAEALADLVRAMNCYYSNLIEGHDTHPIDIERAIRKSETFSLKPKRISPCRNGSTKVVWRKRRRHLHQLLNCTVVSARICRASSCLSGTRKRAKNFLLCPAGCAHATSKSGGMLPSALVRCRVSWNG